ncbi:hypothetical protein B4U84_00480 [Westiellopsis prolifica IICB1]|nr:hypothetical protein B4U84_00480 [Westiellopsis prolifica IICB1]
MDNSRIGAQTVDLLSRITGQKLSQRDITPLVIFLANLVTLLLGVIFVDGTVAESEKQRSVDHKLFPKGRSLRIFVR